jgi:hypothetical protein
MEQSKACISCGMGDPVRKASRGTVGSWVGGCETRASLGVEGPALLSLLLPFLRSHFSN